MAVSALSLVTTTVFAADIFVIGGKPDDPFWSRVKKGAEDAGVCLLYTSPSPRD